MTKPKKRSLPPPVRVPDVDDYRRLLDLSKEWVYWIDPEGRFVYSSPGCETITGYTVDNFFQNSGLFRDLVLAEEQGNYDKHLQIHVLDGDEHACEMRFHIQTKSGERRCLAHSCQPYLSPSGEYLGRRVVVRDITVQAQQEAIGDALLEISEAVHGVHDLQELLEVLDRILSRLMPIPNIFFARYDAAKQQITFPYVRDERDQTTYIPRPLGRGLTEYVLQQGRTMLLDLEAIDELIRQNEIEAIGSPPVDWLGLPLEHEGTVFGVLAVQSYDETIRYTQKDAEILTFVSRQISQSIFAKYSQEQVALAEEKFSKAFHSTPEAIIISELETGKIQEINRSFEELSGYFRDEVIGVSGLDLNMWPSPEKRDEFISLLRQKGSVREIPGDFLDRKGKLLHTRIAGDTFEISGVQHMITIIRDVTVEKENEEKIRLKDELLSQILDLLPVGVWLSDARGKIIRINPMAQRIWNGARYVGPEDYDVYKAWHYPSMRPVQRDTWAGVTALQGRTTIGEELEIECFDGSHKIVTNSAIPMRNAEGNIIGIIVVQQDITLLKHIEVELKAGNEFLQTLIDAIPEPVYYKNNQNILVGCNRAFTAFLGIAREEVIGKNATEIFLTDKREEIEALDHRLRQTKGQGMLEAVFQLNNGVTRAVILNKAAYRNRDGSVGGIIGMIHDITQLKATQQALVQSEQTAVGILNSVQQGFIMFDFDLHLILFNPLGQEIIEAGIGRSIAIGEDAAEIFRPSVKDEYLIALKHASKGEIRTFIRHFDDVHGQPHALKVQALPVRNEQNDIFGCCLSALDISELEQAQARVRHLSSALEQSSLLIFILSLKGKIEYVNRQVELRTGYSEEQLVGQSMSLFYFDDPEWMLEMFERVANTGEVMQTETLISPRSGLPFWASMKLSAIQSESGTTTHFLVQEEDISERRLREDSLNQSEAKYRELFETAPYGIIVLDHEQNITNLNVTATRFCGYSKEESYGHTMDHWIDENYHSHWEEFIQEALGTGSSHIEMPLRRKDGSIFWVELTAAQQFDETGEMSGLLLHCLDINVRQQIEVQLRHAQKMESIGQLAAGIAHEINTPTQFVSDNLRFLSETFASLHKLIIAYHEGLATFKEQPEGQDVLQEVHEMEEDIDLDFVLSDIPQAFLEANEGLMRISKIVKAMKEFSHPETDTKTPTDINHAIESTVTVARNEWKYVADLDLDLDPEMPMVPCLPGEFNQVILNIVINAAHAIEEAQEKSGQHEKGKITISTRQENGMAVIRITDSGTGIPKEIHNRVFDPFFTTKRVGRGTGQGLAISHSVIVDKHHGKLHFTTEEGKGTTFILELPLDDSQPEPETKPEEHYDTIG